MRLTSWLESLYLTISSGIGRFAKRQTARRLRRRMHEVHRPARVALESLEERKMLTDPYFVDSWGGSVESYSFEIPDNAGPSVVGSAFVQDDEPGTPLDYGLSTNGAPFAWLYSSDGSGANSLVYTGGPLTQSQYTFTGTVTDQYGLTDSATFYVSVLPINDAPTLVNLNSWSSTSVPEGSTVTFDLSVADPDGDLLTLNVWDNTGAIYHQSTVGTGSHSLQFTLADDLTTDVYASVSDPFGEVATLLLGHVVVTNVAPTAVPNDPFAVNTTQNGDGTATVNVDFAFADPGLLDTHWYEINWGDGVSETNATSPGHVSLNHYFTTPGTFGGTVTVYDDDYGSLQWPFQVVVNDPPPPPNTAPTFVDPWSNYVGTYDWWVDETLASGTEIGQVRATDDYDAESELTFTITAGNDAGLFVLDGNTPRSLRLASNKHLDYETATQHTLTLRATDTDGASTDITAYVNVMDGFNTPPTLNIVGDTDVRYGEALSLHVEFNDAEDGVDPSGTRFTYEWDLNNNGIYGEQVDHVGRQLNLTYAQLIDRGFQYDSPQDIRVRTFDTEGALGEAAATVTLHPNETPVGVVDEYLVVVDREILVRPTANDTDAEGDAIDFDVVRNPDFGTLERVNGKLKYTPGPLFVGIDSFEYRPKDSLSPYTSDAVTVTLTVIDPTEQSDVTLSALATLSEVSGSDLFTSPDSLPFQFVSNSITSFSQFSDFIQSRARIIAAKAAIANAVTGATTNWTTSEVDAWDQLKVDTGAAANALAIGIQTALDTAFMSSDGSPDLKSTIEDYLCQAEGALNDLEPGVDGALNAFANGISPDSGGATLPSINGMGSPAFVSRGQLNEFTANAYQMQNKMIADRESANRRLLQAVETLDKSYATSLNPQFNSFADKFVFEYGRFILRSISAGIGFITQVRAAGQAYSDSLPPLQTAWLTAVRTAYENYQTNLVSAQSAFQAAVDSSVSSARTQIRDAFSLYAQRAAEAKEDNNSAAQDLARRGLRHDIAQAQLDHLSRVAGAYEQFALDHGTASGTLAATTGGAKRAYTLGVSAAVAAWRDAFNASYQSFLNTLNNHSKDRDLPLNEAYTKLADNLATANDEYSKKLLSALKTRDEALVTIAGQHDTAYLAALESLVANTSGSGDPIATADADTIRTTIAKMKHVANLAGTLTQSLQSASETAITRLVNNETAFVKQVNQLGKTLDDRLIQSETIAIAAAFAARKGYEDLVTAADHSYISDATSAEVDYLLAIAAELSDEDKAKILQELDVFESGWTSDLDPDNNLPAPDSSIDTTSVTVQRFTFSIDDVLLAIDAWLMSQPADGSGLPPLSATGSATLDYGLPETDPAWLTTLRTEFGADVNPEHVANTYGINLADPGVPAWMSEATQLVAAAEQRAANGIPEYDRDAISNTPAPLFEITNTNWLARYEHAQVFLGTGTVIALAGTDADGHEISVPEEVLVRTVDGHFLAARYNDLPAVTSYLNRTIADWDEWFRENGTPVQLSPEALTAVQQHIQTEKSYASSNASGLRFLTLRKEMDRLNAINQSNFGQYSNYQYDFDDIITFDHLRATAESRLGIVAGQLFAEYGYADMRLLYTVIHVRKWELVVGDLTNYPTGLPGDEAPASTGPNFRIANRVITINDRSEEVSGTVLVPHSLLASRARTALASNLITSGNYALESVSDVAWTAFWNSPQTRGTIGMGLATVEVVGGIVLAKAGLGFFSAPGVVMAFRGSDNFIAALQTYWQTDPNLPDVKSFTNQALAGIYGQEAADTGEFMIDAGLALGELSGVTRQAIVATRTKLVLQAERQVLRGGDAALDVAKNAGKLVDDTAAASVIKAVDPPPSATGRMSPGDIRFTQDTISPRFSDGRELTDQITKIRKGDISPDDFPAIDIVEYKGKVYSLDNRRLAVFKISGVDDIPVRRLDLADPSVKSEFLKKFRPINDGLNVVVVPKSGRADARRLLREFKKYGSN